MSETPNEPTELQVRNNEIKLQLQYQELLHNVLSMRKGWIDSLLDPRRDYDQQFGYPKTGSLTCDVYRDQYDRNPVAARVVEIYPRETWKSFPDVYESEEQEEITYWEQKWKELPMQLDSGSLFADEENSSIWEVLKRADIYSRIGSYGVILIGINDGKDLDEPAQMWNLKEILKEKRLTQGTPTKPKPVSKEVPTTKPTAKPPVENLNGTDQQYGDPFKVGDLAATDVISEPEEGAEVELLYLRVFDETTAKIKEWDNDRNSPRYGRPKVYSLTFYDPRSAPQTGIGQENSMEVNVHWSRVVHIADNIGTNPSIGTPAQQPVENNILNIHKLVGGSAEMYYRGAFPGLSIETHPQLGGDVKIDKPTMRDMMEKFQNDLQRFLALEGMTAKTLAPQVVDPNPQIEVQIDQICIRLDCPKRIFCGSERGELASTQDDEHWNEKVMERRSTHNGPRIIIPFITRLAELSVLPIPEEPLKLKWPELDKIGAAEKADIALKQTQAMVAFVNGNGESMITKERYFMKFLDWSQEETLEAKKELEERPDEERATQSPEEAAAEQAQMSMDHQSQMADKDREFQAEMMKTKMNAPKTVPPK